LRLFKSEVRLFSQCLCDGLNKSYCREGFLVPAHP
jgi:hypothetical protein